MKNRLDMQVSSSQSMISEFARQCCAGTKISETYLAEAEFGLPHVLEIVNSLPAEARVLEVGSGPCILLDALARARPDLKIHGIEPLGSGFAHFDPFIRQLTEANSNFQLFRGGYEDFRSSDQWDLIFLINVFEHLPDWPHFLEFVKQNLSPNGRCLILAPNYGFPYESHFGFPVMGGKSLTQWIFAKRIAAFERDHELSGLYASLNFVRLRDVRRVARRIGLAIDVDTSIMQTLIERLDVDPIFAKRHRKLALLVRLANRSGLLNWAVRRSAFQDMMPYMKLILQKTAP